VEEEEEEEEEEQSSVMTLSENRLTGHHIL